MQWVQYRKSAKILQTCWHLRNIWLLLFQNFCVSSILHRLSWGWRFSFDLIYEKDNSYFYFCLFDLQNSVNCRALALNSVNCILLVQTEPLNNIMDVFLQQLFALANDVDTVFLTYFSKLLFACTWYLL